METEMWRFEARVRGRVQGVGFRAFVYHRAQDLGLAGAVRNAEDGSVWVVAEGSRATLETFLAALWQGPRAAHVTDVATDWGPPTGLPVGPFRVEI